LARDGVTVTEIAPGIDLKRDILDQAAFPLRVAAALKTMDPALFRPEPIGLRLKAAPPHGAREAAE
jgi:acyl CoA:acetate/3-ketoacid CoA transferase